MSPKGHIYYTFEGKIVFGLWLGKASDPGVYIGPVDESGSHITILWENGEIGSHITEPPHDSIHIASTSLVELGAKLQRALKGAVVSYHGNKKCWAINPMLAEKLNSLQTRDGENFDTYFPLDQWIKELLRIIERNELLQRVRVRSLIDPEPRFAIMETKPGVIDLVLVSQTKVLAASRLLRILMRFTEEALGIEYLLKRLDDGLENFLKTEDGKRFLSEARNSALGHK